MMGDAMLDVHDVSKATTLSRRTIYRLVEAGKFPKATKLGARRAAWPASEIEKHLGMAPGGLSHVSGSKPVPSSRLTTAPTLRDQFAMVSLSSLLVNGQFLDPAGLFTQNGAEAVAEGAYLLADAMLAERQKGGA